MYDETVSVTREPASETEFASGEFELRANPADRYSAARQRPNMERLLQNFLKLRDGEPEEQNRGSIFRRLGTMARGMFALALVAGFSATLGGDVAAARAPIV